MNSREQAKQAVKSWLVSNSKHISAHDRGPGSYCYITEDGYDYSDHASGPVSVDEAFSEDWFWVSEKGVESCCPHQIPTLPLEFDYGKIRRRIEDAVRKTADQNAILKIAWMFDIKLT